MKISDDVDFVIFFIFMTACIFAVAGMVYFIQENSFSARCEDAGYSGAAHERCILRAANGGPIYEENE